MSLSYLEYEQLNYEDSYAVTCTLKSKQELSFDGKLFKAEDTIDCNWHTAEFELTFIGTDGTKFKCYFKYNYGKGESCKFSDYIKIRYNVQFIQLIRSSP